ncbi:MAG: homogentisate 1,2-dioxygenase [Oligoflexia bacterium]
MQYLIGLGNQHLTEAKPGAVPRGQNSPQNHPLGLYPEQLSGTSFLAPRHENQRTWLYRLQPSVVHGHYLPSGHGKNWSVAGAKANPEQTRWNPVPFPAGPTSFVDGVRTICTNGNSRSGQGLGVHVYAFNQSMSEQYLCCADGELLFVPQEGELVLATEMGILEVAPLEIAVIPRGVKFQVRTKNPARGYLAENHGAPLRLPELGPIGANGLASARDFLVPVAAFETKKTSCELITKYLGEFFSCELDHSPLDVVGWHGNYYPYKYDLRLFNTINTVSFDHPDPSIFTVLSSPSDTPGTSNLDFVIFPPRWMVAEKTFRPPYFHRNLMSEFMGLIVGEYDAKAAGKSGFSPGGASLHNMMSAHGPDRQSFEQASQAELKPKYVNNTMAFMFESRYPFDVVPQALQQPFRQADYLESWKGLGRLSID